MAEEFDWDNSGIVMPSDNYFKFNDIGDSITGVITDIESKTFDGDSSPTAQLYLLVEGEEDPIIVTCGSTNLKSLILNTKPQRGQTITITHNGKSGRTKLFDVKVAAAAPVEDMTA